ncbi:hypothetical protein DPMN_081122 [Dreissena polymorpha]|uniref:Uncharacterized protein n=1 Tax=Dreissena polymorpha TaxID=45954 RepID=A0A9D4BG01_DREPO|nr:hypothetical protein DPMN_081122 [Dreissena polymorpha]
MKDENGVVVEGDDLDYGNGVLVGGGVVDDDDNGGGVVGDNCGVGLRGENNL